MAWTWRAGGPAVANSDGTITAQVSANTDYGFSICKITTPSSDGAYTFGHGLNGVPKLVIYRIYDQSMSWYVHHGSLNANEYLLLNNSNAKSSSSYVFNNTNPTSSLISDYAGNSSHHNEGRDMIYYCFSEVSGYSKFGSYTGNASTTGPVVTLGFRPRFVLIKNATGSANNWMIIDSERGGTGDIDELLFASSSSAENTSQNRLKFTSTGFQVIDSSGGFNENSQTFIYAAFADRPGNNWDVNNIVTNEGLTTSKTQFDVVTYTGNGGTQKLGGPVFSSSADSGLTHADGVTGMFDGSLSTRGGAPSTDNSYKTLTDGASISASTGIRIYWNGVGAGQRYIRINGTTELDDGSAALTPGWSTQSSFSGTINKIEVKTASSGSWSLAAVEVDGTILIDGTGPGLKFQPDFVWIKSRSSGTEGHYLANSVSGLTKNMRSNATSAEQTNTNGVIAADANGFTLGDSGRVNGSSQNYVPGVGRQVARQFLTLTAASLHRYLQTLSMGFQSLRLQLAR